MGFRFRRSIGILPGVKLNLSRSGPSVSLGRRGLHYTIGRKGNRFTVGLPGTGVSYTDYEPHHRSGAEEEPGPAGRTGSPGRRHTPVLGFLLFVVLMAAYALWSAWLH